MKSSSEKGGLDTKYIGFPVLIMGALFNEWVIAALFSGDGIISYGNLIKIRIIQCILAAIGCALIYWRARIRIPSLKTALISFAIGMMCAIFIEWGMRLYLVHLSPKETYLEYATFQMISKRLFNNEFRYSLHPYLGYVPTPGFRSDNGDRHNSLGYRGEELTVPKPDGEYRIVCIGGSTTYTTGAETYKDSYPYLMEKDLQQSGFPNVRVVNAGVGNADTWYSLINLLFRVLEIEPDMVVVYHGDNDVESRMIYPLTRYQSDNSGRMASCLVNFDQENNFLNRSVILRIVSRSLFGYGKSYGSLHKLFSANTCVYQDYFTQLDKGIYPKGVFKKIDAMDLLDRNKPVYLERNLRNMIAVCRANHIRIVLSSFTTAPKSGETASPLYQKAIRENNAIMKRLSEEHQIPFFDFKKKMPLDDDLWGKRGVHVTEKGARIKAKLFAQFVKDHIKT